MSIIFIAEIAVVVVVAMTILFVLSLCESVGGRDNLERRQMVRHGKDSSGGTTALFEPPSTRDSQLFAVHLLESFAPPNGRRRPATYTARFTPQSIAYYPTGVGFSCDKFFHSFLTMHIGIATAVAAATPNPIHLFFWCSSFQTPRGRDPKTLFRLGIQKNQTI